MRRDLPILSTCNVPIRYVTTGTRIIRKCCNFLSVKIIPILTLSQLLAVVTRSHHDDGSYNRTSTVRVRINSSANKAFETFKVANVVRALALWYGSIAPISAVELLLGHRVKG